MTNIILIIALIVIAFVLLCITPEEEITCHECGGKCDEIEQYTTSMKRLYRCRKCGKEFWVSW